MHKAKAEHVLRELGYQIDWSVTGPSPEGGWDGTIDAIGRGLMDGDCRGAVIFGDNAADWYRNAVAEARSIGQVREYCRNPDCEFHIE
ncbi:MAG: hypothetical protein AAFY06_00030 [Pseudomonadota bacterium]